jgi:hypothetical protein
MPLPLLDFIPSILNIGSKIIDRLWPDPAERDKAKLELMKMQQEGDLAVLNADLQQNLAQIQANIFEAQNPSIFVAGWRPAIGWVCASAIAYTYVLQPFLSLAIATWKPEIALPRLDMGDLMVLVLGMLGIGGMRSYEKVQGVAK